jgi:predicted PurR-regulated permease PerM
MKITSKEGDIMVYEEYHGRPYAMLIAVVLSFGAVVYGAVYVFMMVFDKIYELITKTPTL